MMTNVVSDAATKVVDRAVDNVVTVLDVSKQPRFCRIEIINSTDSELTDGDWYSESGHSTGDSPPPLTIPAGKTAIANYSKTQYSIFGGCSGLLSYSFSATTKIVILFKVPLFISQTNVVKVAIVEKERAVDSHLYREMLRDFKRKSPKRWQGILCCCCTCNKAAAQPIAFGKCCADKPGGYVTVKDTHDGVTVQFSMTGDTKSILKVEVFKKPE